MALPQYQKHVKLNVKVNFYGVRLRAHLAGLYELQDFRWSVLMEMLVLNLGP